MEVYDKMKILFQGVKALKTPGGNFVFEVSPINVKVEAKKTDEVFDAARINVISIVPHLTMKTAALGRGKAKDEYYIYFCIRNYAASISALADQFRD